MSGVMISFLGSAVAGGGAVPQVVSNANPLPVTLSGGIGGLAVAGTIAAGAAVGAQFPVTVGGIDGGGLARQLLTDTAGVLQVNATLAGGSLTVVQATAANLNGTMTQGPGNTGNPWTVGGPVASGVAVVGNPVSVGGSFNTTPTVIASGQRGEMQLDSNSQVRARLVTSQVSAGDAQSNAGMGAPLQSSGTSALSALIVAGLKYNGATWDRDYKPRTAFRLPSSAATNNAANIKTTPGTVLGLSFNVTLAASTCYVKFFDTTGVPNPAAQNPLYMFAANINDNFVSVVLPAGGLYFPTGIGIAIVANPADLDNTAIAAGQVTALNVPFQ